MSKSKPIPMAEMEDTSFIQNNPPDHDEGDVPRTITSTSGPNRSKCVKIIVCIVLAICILAALIAICVWLFFLSGDPRGLFSAFFRTNTPQLEFRPMSSESETLIWYSNTNYKTFTDKLDDFLAEYRNPSVLSSVKIQQCDYNHPPDNGSVCDVDIKYMAPCVKENYYNYHRGAPCVFLRLNHHKEWMPEFYNRTVDLPDDIPQQLKESISTRERRNRYSSMNVLWVSCDGASPADAENIGPITYIPERGFPGYYFPYVKQHGYLSPLVAVHFERPQRGVIINVECRMYARNIEYNNNVKMGTVNFELLID